MRVEMLNRWRKCLRKDSSQGESFIDRELREKVRKLLYIDICVYIYIILSKPSFGGEVKPSVPCRRFAAYKRSLNLCGSRNLGKISGQISRPRFHLSLLGPLASLRTYRHLAAKVGTCKGGEKQWKTTPKNLPRMQCARAIPVTWLGSGYIYNFFSSNQNIWHRTVTLSHYFPTQP